MLLLPECFAFIGETESARLAVAEAVDPDHPGPILAALVEIAREHSIWVIGGGMPELPDSQAASGAPERAYNTCVVIAPDGELVARYRKIHLFDVDIPGRAQIRESAATLAGDSLVSVQTDFGRVGLSICYDLRFPELYRQLAVHHQCELLVVPAAFTAHTGAAHWHVLLRARAIENQCYVLAAGQVGRHNPKRESFGHSLFIDPWGVVRDEVETGTGLASGAIDSDFLAQKRDQLPCLQHRVLEIPQS